MVSTHARHRGRAIAFAASWKPACVAEEQRDDNDGRRRGSDWIHGSGFLQCDSMMPASS